VLLLLLVCLIVTWLGYAPALGGFFVSDDFVFLHTEAQITSWLDRLAVPRGAPFFRPLSMLSYGIDAALGGPSPLVYRAHGVILHAFTAWLVGLLAWRMFGNAPAAWLPALWFCTCPLHHEAITWVASRCYALAGLLLIAACHAGMGYAQLGGRWRSSGFLLFTGATLLCCEAAAPLVLCMAFGLACFAADRARGRYLCIAPLAMLIAYVVVRTIVLGGLGGYRAADGASVQAALDVGQLFGYLGSVALHLLAPGPWGADRPDWIWPAVLTATVLNAAVLAVVPWQRHHGRKLLAGVVLLLVALSVAMTWGRLTPNLVGSRLVYLPSMLVALGLGGAVAATWTAARWRRRFFVTAVAGALFAQTLLLRVVNGWWHEGGAIVESMLEGVREAKAATDADVLVFKANPRKHHGAEVAGRGFEDAVALFVDPALRMQVVVADEVWRDVVARRDELRAATGVRALLGEWDSRAGRWLWH
jgi:hypothetical protein